MIAFNLHQLGTQIFKIVILSSATLKYLYSREAVKP